MAVIIFKTIEKCNSNCVYCDVIKKHQDNVMSFDLLELIFEKINEYLTNKPKEKVYLTWHGGEVCLLGAGYFEKAFELQEKHCSETKSRIEHLVQSNLTLINQKIINAMRKLDINQIGSSYEPLPHIRGFGKKRDSDAYNRRFLKGSNLLNDNDINWGVIYVVHRKSLEKPLDIFHYLMNMNLQSQPNFNKVYIFDEDKHNLAITPEEFADFLGAIFPVWWEHKDRYPNVEPFCGITKNIKDKNMELVCESSGNCGHEWVYIGPEGDTSQCGRSGDYGVLSYGRIQDLSLEKILGDKQRNQIPRRQAVLPKTECKDCRFWGMCHGGCPLDAFMVYGDFNRRTPNCDVLRIFVEKYFEPITGLRADFRPQN